MPGAPTEGTDDGFEALWQRVLAAWDDDKVHSALVEYAVRMQRLPDAAGRYRALTTQPDKKARADKQLAAIVAAATQMLLAMKTPPRTKPPASITLSAVGICAVLLGLLAYALLHR